mgnify:CR=1 FL=1
MRAQWAARPLVWHIYPQQAGAHYAKLEAFMARYAAGLAAPSAAAWRDLMRAWNGAPGAPDAGEAWAAAAVHRAAITTHAQAWAAHLAQGPELAASLAKFIRASVK